MNEFDNFFDVNHDGKLDFCEDAMRHKVAMDIMDGTFEKKFPSSSSVRTGGYSYNSDSSKTNTRSGSVPVVKKEAPTRKQILFIVLTKLGLKERREILAQERERAEKEKTNV